MNRHRSLLLAGVLVTVLIQSTGIRAEDATLPTILPALPDKTKDKPLPEVFRKAQPESLDDLRAIEKHVKGVLDKVMRCTVCIRVGSAAGSGVIVSEDGYVLTAAHMFNEAGLDITVILPDGSRHPGKTLGGDGTVDCALVKITEDRKWPFVEMGSSAQMKRNDWCLGTGHPGGFRPGRSPVVRVGRILDINEMTEMKFIRSDCTIVSGDSGGPLFDMHGRVIGIHSRISNSITANLHVPIDAYRDSWTRLAAGERWGGGAGRPARAPTRGEPEYGFKLDPDNKNCMINSILVECPAFKAGLRAGDFITRFEGKQATTVAALLEEFKKKKPGDQVTFVVRRGEETVTVKFAVDRKEGS